MRLCTAPLLVGIPLVLLFFLSAMFLSDLSQLREHPAPWGHPAPSADPEPSEPVDTAEEPVPGRARRVKASELLARPPTAHAGSIPRIFHQSWKTARLPAKFENWSMTCRQTHADWEWVIWTDEDNLRLVQKYFPWLEATYRGLPAEIYRADLARYLYMYIYGGVYADLDVECLQPTEDLQGRYGGLFGPVGAVPLSDTAVFGRMGDDPEYAHSIPNAWMASKPGHPVFLVFLEAFAKQARGFRWRWRKTPEDLTGPVALREAIVQYEVARVRHGYGMSPAVRKLVRKGPFAESAVNEHQVLLLPSDVIYPYSWGPEGKSVRAACWVVKKSFDAERCKELVQVRHKKSITITYWSHTHNPDGPNDKNIKQIEADS